MNKKSSSNKDLKKKKQPKENDMGHDLAELFNSLCEESGDDTRIYYEPKNADND